MDQRNFQQIGTIIRIGAEILMKSQEVLNAERLRNNHSPNAPKKAAWPAFLMEDDLSAPPIVGLHNSYSSRDVTDAWKVFEILAKLPYDNEEKKIALRYCRKKYPHRSWAKSNPHTHWAENRRIGEKILVHLVQALGKTI